MPNWCMNTLEVVGNLSEVNRFNEQFNKPHKAFSGGILYLANGEQKSKEQYASEYLGYKVLEKNPDGSHKKVSLIREILHRTGLSFNNFVPMSMEDHLNDWYEWSIENWGTKWDIYDGVEDPVVKLEEDVYKQSYHFETAWAEPTKAVEAMVEQYPELNFKLFYDEPGMGHHGVTVF